MSEKKFLDYTGLTKLAEEIDNKYVSKDDIASTSSTGVVKPDGTSITIDANGTITANSIIYVTRAQYEALGDSVLTDGKTYAIIDMPAGYSDIASATDFGVVKINGETISINDSGFLYANIATNSSVGVVKPDGTTVTVDSDGTLHGANTYTLPTASTTTLGGVKVDGSTITINDSVISADIPTSLPANGGNSTTVNNHTVNSDVPANAVFTDTNSTSGSPAVATAAWRDIYAGTAEPTSLPVGTVYLQYE